MAFTSLQLSQFGPIEESLHLTEQQQEELQPGQLRVQMLAAPINPADINVIEGKYPIPVEPPCTIGNEGVGKIIEVAGNAAGFKPGQRVVTFSKLGSWCGQRIVHQDEVILVPDSICDETAAMITVNPPTAWRMIHDFVSLQPGDWLIQNAANSIVGRSVIHFAKHLSLHTVNIVRREELIPELTQAGADIVLLDEERFSKTVKEATGGAEIKLGLNAVGGKNATEVAKSLAQRGCLVTYGAMGMQPLEIPNGLLIFKNVTFAGFWLTQWYKRVKPLDVKSMYGNIFSLLDKNPLPIPVEAKYSLNEFQKAIKHAQEGSKNGKVLFKMED